MKELETFPFVPPLKCLLNSSNRGRTIWKLEIGNTKEDGDSDVDTDLNNIAVKRYGYSRHAIIPEKVSLCHFLILE